MEAGNDKMYPIKIRNIIIVLFILTCIIQGVTAPMESVGFISQLKYIMCIITIGFCLIPMIKTNRIYIFKYELTNILWIILIFFVISIIKSILVYSFTSRTIQELIFLLIPPLFAFGILNTLDFRTVNKCMQIALIIFMIGYFLEIGLNISEFFQAFKTMNFSDSYSALESSTFAGVSIAMAMYFLYFRENKIARMLSVCFVIFTFKRLSLLFTLFLLILPKIFNFNKKVNKSILLILKILVFGISIGYYLIMIPENVQKIDTLFNIDLYKITMSRTYRFSLIYNKPDFLNTGLGATFSYMKSLYGVALEMDMIKLLIEVTPIGAFIFINNMFNIVKKNWYCMVLMLYQLFNLITSHNLANIFSWIIFYITLGCILYANTLNEKLSNNKIKEIRR